MWYELATNFCIINSKRQVEGELRHVVQIDVAVFRKGESKTLMDLCFDLHFIEKTVCPAPGNC